MLDQTALPSLSNRLISPEGIRFSCNRILGVNTTGHPNSYILGPSFFFPSATFSVFLDPCKGEEAREEGATAQGVFERVCMCVWRNCRRTGYMQNRKSELQGLMSLV